MNLVTRGTDPELDPGTPGTDDPRLSKPWVRTLVRWMSHANTAVYRLTGGRVGGTWRVGSALRNGVDICLLTSTGRRSGEERTVPLLHLPDGDRVLLVASQGGLPQHPAWYYNVRADPNVTVQFGQRKHRMTARVATEHERADLWPRLVDKHADFAEYQRNTARQIPVVICEPRR